MKRVSLILGIFLALAASTEAVRFRCGILSFFGNDRACRLSCFVTGQKTGSCDEDNNCNCGEEESDLKKIIREKFQVTFMTNFNKPN